MTLACNEVREKGYSIDLSAHMAECEANYARLMRLMPMLVEGGRSTFAITLGESEPQVILRIVERHKYTTVIELSQLNGQGNGDAGDLPETRLEVRVYHDAKAAEVITFQDQRRFRAVYGYPNRQMRHPDEKVQVNRFLGEFLQMCVEHGISIESPAAASFHAVSDRPGAPAVAADAESGSPVRAPDARSARNSARNSARASNVLGSME